MLRRTSLDFILLTFETRCFILFFEKSGECICEVLEGGLKDGAIYLLDRAVPFLTVAVEPHRRSLSQQERMFYKNIEKLTKKATKHLPLGADLSPTFAKLGKA